MERINLSQLRKCDQRWEDMTPSEKGRICSQCNKHIVDFRKMTATEVARTHAFSEDPVCGLYSPHQLEPIVRSERKGLVNKRLSLFMASLGLFYSEQVSAQEPDPKEQTIQREDIQPLQERSDPLSHGPELQDTLMVIGKVVDEQGEPVPFATIRVKGTKLGTNSDFDGNYAISIPMASRSDEEVILVFNYVGFGTRSFNLGRPLALSNEPIVVNMEFINRSVVAFGVTIGTSKRAGLWTELRRIFGKRYR